MKQLWTLLTLALVATVAYSSRASEPPAAAAEPSAGGTIVVLTASVLRSAPENCRVVTNALEKVLDRGGYRVISGERVDREIQKLELDQPRIHPVAKIQELRKILNVDYVVYPRILTVGQGLEANESQINIIVNVAGRSKPGSFCHTRQVGEVFKPAVLVEKPVVDAESAEKAAAKLFEGFIVKRK